MATLVISVAMLSGCAEMNLFGHYAKQVGSTETTPPNSATVPTYKIGKPYQVNGVWYYPQEDFGYDETGVASWYGPDFHGKLTANGEMFDQNAVSAAHKTLPLPSVVQVTNLENGRSLVVRVNDRGPFVHGRVIDMSRRAAQLLGFEGQGTARVRVQVMADESRVLAGKLAPSGSSQEPAVVAAPRGSVAAESLPPPGSSEKPKPVVAGRPSSDNASLRATAAAEATERQLASQEVGTHPVRNTSLYVQAGSFSRHDNALRLSARLSGVGSPRVEQISIKGKTLYRVRFGPLSTVDEADRVLERVIAAGQQDARVIVD